MADNLPNPYATRFTFLFPPSNPATGFARPRYRVHAPDLHDIRWSVFDHQEAYTIARGATPEEAVDNAIVVVAGRSSQPASS